MPGRNVLKIDVPESYYHVYARGVGNQNIFLDDNDFRFFLSLFERYLSPVEVRNSAGVAYEKLHNGIEILCYCLMGSYFHILLHQRTAGTMSRLMRGVMTSYSRYFNAKYSRSGPLFESRYKASRLSSPAFVQHVSRYIHLVPKDWQSYPYSSVEYYLSPDTPDWLHPELIMKRFASRGEYRAFVSDREAAEHTLETLKPELANNV